MPDITADIINTIADNIFEGSIHTAYTDMKPELKEDPNTVKVIVGKSGFIRWFGRGFKYGYHHLGIYGFDRRNLMKYVETPQSEHEKIEKLEQLRWIDTGLDDWGFFGHKVNFDGIEINTPDDAEKWNARWKSMGNN
jgi:3-deoxy-manno-octulosonate cytidylyltransferase (CMP-KDO synthetase)